MSQRECRSTPKDKRNLTMLNLQCRSDLIVFSHNHFGSEDSRTTRLMNKFASQRRVFFIESPIIGKTKEPTYYITREENEVMIVKPYLPAEMSVFERKSAIQALIKELIADENISHYTIWTDTPKAMPFVRHLSAEIIVYDCVKSYILTHPELEQELYQHADIVLTSGMLDLSPVEDELVYINHPCTPELVLHHGG